MGAAPAQAQYTYAAPPAQTLFQQVDANNDGIVTRQEFAQAFAPQPTYMMQTAPSMVAYQGLPQAQSMIAYVPTQPPAAAAETPAANTPAASKTEEPAKKTEEPKKEDKPADKKKGDKKKTSKKKTSKKKGGCC